MEYDHLTTGEKFEMAQEVLENVSEDEIGEEDMQQYRSAHMEVMDLSGKYE